MRHGDARDDDVRQMHAELLREEAAPGRTSDVEPDLDPLIVGGARFFVCGERSGKL